MKRAILSALADRRAAGRPVALVTRIADGVQALVAAEGVEGGLPLGTDALRQVRRRLGEDRSGRLAAPDDGLFCHVFNPPLRLAVVGAVHISQALVPMAALAGYAVTVIDPRRAWATDARFPGVTMSRAWPDDAMTALAPDHRTAVVTLTHDPKLDDPALAVALRSEAFYIGALGSRRTHSKRLDRLTELGFGVADFARIHGPVGLAIGAVSPAEIAVSILAQMTAVLRAEPGGRP